MQEAVKGKEETVSVRHSATPLSSLTSPSLERLYRNTSYHRLIAAWTFA